MGITCTKKRVFYALAFLRIVSVLFIFISSMSFVGGTECVNAEKEADVAWLGNFSAHEDIGTLLRRVVRREACQGRTNNSMYYGEFRDNKVCELDLRRIGRTVHFDFFTKCDGSTSQRVPATGWNNRRITATPKLKTI